MTESPRLDRRDVLLTTGTLAAGVLAGVAVPAVHAAGSEEIKVALVGCGGRGTGAAENALRTKSGPIKLYAMADVFSDRLDGSYNSLDREYKKQMDVPPARRFIGFDAYKDALDTLKPGDVAIFATPPAFRWVHFSYAIKKGLNVFMEKPVTVDGPTSRRMLKLGEESVKKGLKVGVGLMCRHCENRQKLYEKVKNGDLGDILLLRAYRMHGPVGSCHVPKKPEKMSELHYQIRKFHAFLWASGGCYSDFLIHNIDECCWMKDGWPVEARASGGRHYRGNNIDQNFDSYSVEYTFGDGTKLMLEGRTIDGCEQKFASYLHGTKGSAVISANNHYSGRCPVYANQKMGAGAKPVWIGPRREPSPYQVEWDRLIDAIRNGKAHNEVKRGVEASLVTAMGRMAAHTGQVVTYQEMLEHDHELAPGVDKLTLKGDAPIKADASGKYAVPNPGTRAADAGKPKREYRG